MRPSIIPGVKTIDAVERAIKERSPGPLVPLTGVPINPDDVARDVKAARGRGVNWAEAILGGVARNAPVTSDAWQIVEAGQGKELGGPNHGRLLGPGEIADRWASGVTGIISAGIALGAGLAGAAGGVARPPARPAPAPPVRPGPRFVEVPKLDGDPLFKPGGRLEAVPADGPAAGAGGVSGRPGMVEPCPPVKKPGEAGLVPALTGGRDEAPGIGGTNRGRLENSAEPPTNGGPRVPKPGDPDYVGPIAPTTRRLLGHNEYKISDPAKAAKTKQDLLDYYKKHAKNPSIEPVEGLAGAQIDTVTGKIKIGQEVLDNYPHLADGYLVEELRHFQVLHQQKMLGRALTAAEEAALEKDIVQFMARKDSGFQVFDPRKR